MRIAIFGATGRTGIQVVNQALQRGYGITAFVRKERKKEDLPSAVQVVFGDLFTLEDVEKAVVNQDAIIVTLGVPGNTKTPIVSEGTRNIVDAMKKFGIERLIVESAHGASESAKEVPQPLRFITRALLKGPFIDKDKMELLVRESDLKWTIVRPTRLTDGPKKGSYKAREHLHRGLRSAISRADVADFMLNQIESSEFVHKAPMIAY